MTGDSSERDRALMRSRGWRRGVRARWGWGGWPGSKAGRRWWWYPISSPRRVHETWDLVSLCIHALLIDHIVSPLDFPPGRVGRAGCDCGTAEETGRGPNCGTGTRVAGGSADRRAQSCTHHRPNHRAAGKILIDRVIRCCSSLLSSPLPAGTVISLEYLEGFPPGLATP